MQQDKVLIKIGDYLNINELESYNISRLEISKNDLENLLRKTLTVDECNLQIEQLETNNYIESVDSAFIEDEYYLTKDTFDRYKRIKMQRGYYLVLFIECFRELLPLLIS